MTIKFSRRDILGGLSASPLLACSPTNPKFDAQIIIIGAGLSGLYAAMLLEEQGKDVLVLEADNRVGGRMYTLQHAEGFTEGGGQQIGASYARVLDVASRLDVPLYEETKQGPETVYYLDGGWKNSSELNISAFPNPYRQTPPSSVLFRLLAKEPALENASAWRDAPEGMDISAAEFLTSRGFDKAGQDLIERALNANSLSTYSMLNLHRTMQLYRQSATMGATKYVTGGSQKLPEAMAASLERPIRLNSFVSHISVHPRHVEIEQSGSNAPLRAEQVICTIPFGSLRKINTLKADLNPAQREAISALPYTQILQFHGHVNSKYWESDGLAPNMWLDNKLERIFAGSDAKGELTGFVRNWINGDGAKDWPKNGDKAAMTESLRLIHTVRPALSDALEFRNVVDWTERNKLAGGAYMHWAPGQAKRWAEPMGRPAGRLYFAGEHLSYLHTGMEGAMESAERTAFDLLNI